VDAGDDGEDVGQLTGNDLMVIFEKPKVESQSWPAPVSPAEPATS
jgi:hypothetical protein